MSGASRAARKTPGSILRCAALFAAFSRNQARLFSVFAKTSTDNAYIDTFMVDPFS